MYIKHTSVRGAGPFGALCPCGIEVVTPAQDKMLELFDGWYGDKAYRQHEYVIKWSDIHAQMIIDNMLASMSFRFEEKEQEHETHPEGGGDRPHRHDDAADGGVQLAGEPSPAEPV